MAFPVSPGAAFILRPTSFPAERGIQGPASPGVQARLAQVPQDSAVRAAGVFQGVREDRQVVKGPLLVDALGNLPRRAVIPRQEGGGQGRRAEQFAEDAAENVALRALLIKLGPVNSRIGTTRTGIR